MTLKVALVHDFLAEWGGAERVVLALHKIFPQAPLYTAFYLPDRLGPARDYFQPLQIKTTFLQQVPFIRRLYSPLRLLALSAFEQLDLSNYDVVISSSNMYMAKGVITRPDCLHICYMHSIPKYLYGYTTARNWRQTLLGRYVAPFINHKMRLLDYLASQRPDILVANSKETAARINKVYRRRAKIIYPPVELGDETKSAPKRQDFILFVGRLVRAKQADLAIRLAQAEGLKLKVVGNGPELDWLKNLAGPETTFLGWVDDDHLKQLYTQAKALIFPAEDEDFGIVPVEAQLFGCPVLAHASGGSLETVKPGVSGVLFDRLDLESIREGWHRLQQARIQTSKVRAWAKRFSFTTFKRQILDLVKAGRDQH